MKEGYERQDHCTFHCRPHTKGVRATEATLQLSQLIELGEKRAKRMRLAGLERELAGWDYEVNRLEVLTEAKKAFVDVLATAERQAFATDFLRLAEQVQRMVSERVKEVATAQPGSLQTQLALSGTMTLNTDRLVRVVSRIPGIVREVRKNLGDAVRAGEAMAVIDSRELADAKGAYLAAGEPVTLTSDTFQREKDLWEKKISPAEDYFKAKQALAEARIELRLAKQKLFALGFSEQALKQLMNEPEASLTRYEVVAPLAGTVIEKHLNVGDSSKTTRLSLASRIYAPCGSTS
jgi:multidrug efflux pump subunit AcrA (membrane-fusion protein)